MIWQQLPTFARAKSRNSLAARAFRLSSPGVPFWFRQTSLTAWACHPRKPGDGGRSRHAPQPGSGHFSSRSAERSSASVLAIASNAA